MNGSPETVHIESCESDISTEVIPSIDWGAASRYFEELFSGSPTEDDVRNLTGYLCEMYPNDAESITAMAQLPAFFATQREVDELKMLRKTKGISKNSKKDSWEKSRALIQKLTQFQFLLTHLLVSADDSEKYLSRFWESAEKLAKQDHSSSEMSMVRDSVLAQAAIFKLFKKLGKDPTLSHPKEDAFDAVDLWTGDHEAIQVKGAPMRESFEVVPISETIAFPGIQVDGEQGTKRHYNDYITHERQYMRGKLENYAAREGHPVEGYLVVIPRNERNPITGEPNVWIVNEAKKHFGIAQANVGGEA